MHVCHEGSVAERSKALVQGTSLFGGMGSYPTAANAFTGAVSWFQPSIPHVGFLPDLCLMAARMDKFNLAELKAPHNYSRKNFHQISENELPDHASVAASYEFCLTMSATGPMPGSSHPNLSELVSDVSD
jgi:hypothetical protein